MISPLRDDPDLRDSRNFLALAWRHLLRVEPTPVQYQIMEWMATGPNRLAVKGFRGVGKSWIASVYCAWRWAIEPNTKILVVSAGQRRAADFTTFTRQLIDSWDLLKELRPEVDALRDSKIQFDVRGASIAHAASMTSLGLTGQLVGHRAGVILADDVETIQNSDTPTKRERVAAYFREFGSILSPGGQTRILGTDQTEETLYRQLPSMGYSVRVWPSEYPRPDLLTALGDSLAPEIRAAVERDPSLAGEPTDPRRFPDEELRAKEVELGRSHYRLQFLLDPRLSDMERYPLRLSDLIVMPLDPEIAPERLAYGGKPADVACIGFSGDKYLGPSHVSERWLPYQGKILAVDPAGRGKDATVVWTLGMLNGYLFALEKKRWIGEGYADSVLASIAGMAARHKVGMVVVEANFGDGMFSRLLEPHLHRTGHHCGLEEVRATVQKERRIIDTLEPVIQQHRLVVAPSLLEGDLAPIEGIPETAQMPYRFAYQLSRITRERGSLVRDDEVDALALGAAWWKDSLAQDAARRQVEQDDRALVLEMEHFERVALNPLRPGRGEAPVGWIGSALGRPAPARAHLPRPPRTGRSPGRSGL